MVRRVEGVADDDLLGQTDDSVEHPVIGGPLDQQPGRERAALAGRSGEPGGKSDGCVDVGIGEHDVRGLAAELHDQGLQRGGAGLLQLASGHGAAGEADLVDTGMGHEGVADVGAAGDDVDHSRRDAGFEAEPTEGDRRERRQLRGLDHDAAAGGQRGSAGHAAEAERPVPGDDDPGDTDRFGDREVDASAGEHVDALARQLVGPPCVVAEPVSGIGRVVEREERAALEAGDGAERLRVLHEEISES